MSSGHLEHAVPRRAAAAAVALFLALAVVHTWPLATDPGGLSRNDNADTMLNAWAVSWVAHQVVRDPVRLFDANIFHPNRHTLAYSEPLVIPGLLGAPLRWLGASPVLTYNVLLLVGFALTALAMYVLVVVWTGDQLAGVLAGALLAYTAHTIARLPQLQAIHAYALPMAVLAFDRLLTRARTRDAVWLGVSVLIAALTSGHLAVFLVFGLGAALAARPECWRGPGARPMLGRLAAAAVATLAIGLAVCWPYVVLGRDEGFQRPLDGVAALAATGWTYLTTTASLHYGLWSHQIFERLAHDALFPTVTGLALAAFALGRRRGWRVPRHRMLLAIAAIGFVLSLGTATPLYGWVYHAFPPVQGIRTASRFGYLVVFAVATLAGIGLASLRGVVRRGWFTPVAVGLIAMATVESSHGPLRFQPYDGLPPIYRVIGQDPAPGAVVELPLYPGGSFHLNAPYVLASTTHWRPLVNGYSGHRPEGFERVAQVLSGFPDDASMTRLRDLGVRYVVVHLDAYPEWQPGAAERIVAETRNHPSVRLVAEHGDDLLYLVLD